MNPDMLMVEADHDMRNPADMLVLGQGRQERDAHRRHRDGPGHHPAAGHSDSAQLDSVSEQHPKPDDHAEHELSQRPHERHSADGRRDADHDRHHRTPGEGHPRPGSRRGGQREDHRGDLADHRHLARPPRRFRRLLAADPQLLLLGEALLRHPDLLVVPVPVRLAGRDRPARREVSPPLRRHRPHRGGDPRAGAAHPDHARDAEDHSWPDADDVSDIQRDDQPDGGDEQHRDRDGPELRQVAERRLLLPAARGLRQPGVPCAASRCSSPPTESRCASSSPTRAIR